MSETGPNGDSSDYCWSYMGSDPCMLPAFHDGEHESPMNGVWLRWSNDSEIARPDPRVKQASQDAGR